MRRSHASLNRLLRLPNQIVAQPPERSPDGFFDRASSRICLRWTLACIVLLGAGLPSAPARAATETWTGGGSANWNLAGNWTGTNLPPIAGDILSFGASSVTVLTNDYPVNTSFGGLTFTTGASAYTMGGNGIGLTGALAVNAASASTTETLNMAIAGTSASSLVFGSDGSGGNNLKLGANDAFGSMSVLSNSATANTLDIGSNTLTINGAFNMNGTGATNAGFNVIGNGGTLAFNTTTANFLVGTAGATETATVDMSQLSNFSYSAGATGGGLFRVGYSAVITATFTLANNTNSITTNTFSVGDSNGSNGRTTTFNFNGTTTINAGTFTLGASKGTANLGFLAGAPLGSAQTPALKIRAQNGTAAATMNLGIGTSGTGNGSTTTNLNGHYVDILAGNLSLAVHSGTANTGTNGNSATLSFDYGVINATTVTLANRSGTGTGNATAVLNVGSAGNTRTATLQVGTGGFNFAASSDTASGTAKGTLDINTGGLVQVSTDMLKTTASAGNVTTNAILILEGGTLDMQSHAIGSAAIPFDTVTLPAVGQTATLANLGGAGITTTASVTGGLNMNGAGTLNLTGTNNFTGGTTVSNGSLRVNGTLAGATDITTGGTGTGTGTYGDVTLDGGTFTPGSATTTGTLSAASLTVNSGTLRLKFGGANADLLNLTGSTNLTNSQLAISQLSPVTNGSYLVLTSGSALSGITPGPLTTIGRTSYTINSAAFTANPKQITVDVAGSPAAVRWTGADSANNPALWNNTQTDANWIRTDGGGGDTTHFYDADNVTFDGTNTGPSDIVVGGTVAPGTITLSGGTYSFGGFGNIAGSGTWTVNSPASLTINTNNFNWTGAVNISGGTVVAGAPQALGTGAVSVSNSGSLSLNASGVLTNNAITLNSGTLRIGDPTAMGTGQFTIGGGSIDNTSGFSMALTGNQPIVINGSFTFLGADGGSHDLILGTGAVTLNTSPTITVNAGLLTIGGVISGAGNSVTKDGNGTLVLSGRSTYTGGTVANAGTLELAVGGGTGAIRGNLTINSGGTVNTSATNALGFTNTTVKVNTVTINGGVLNDTATGDQGWSVAYVLNGGTMQSNGGVSDTSANQYFAFGGFAGADTSVTTLANAASSVIGGRINLRNDNGNNNVTFTVADGAAAVDLLVSAAISQNNTNATPAVGITKTGPGVMVLSGETLYTGPTNVSAGTLRLVTTDGNNISISSTINVAGGAMLDVTQITGTDGFTLSSPQILTNNGTVTGLVTAGFGTALTGTGIYGDVALNNGGTLTPGSSAAFATVAAGNLTVNGGKLHLKFGGSNADRVNLSGGSNITNSGLAIDQLSLPTPGQYLVLTATSPLAGITPGVLSSVGRVTYSIDSDAYTANPNQVLIDIIGSAATLKWTGADSANDPTRWNNSQTDANWQRTDGGTNDPTHFYDQDTVVFDGTNAGPSSLTITGTVAPAAVTISAGNYTFGGFGAIGGSTGITINSGASLTLDNDNTYTGATLINAGGTLRIGDPNVNGGASGSMGTGPATVNGTLYFNRSDTFTVSNAVGGNGTIHMAGTGTLTLGAANSFSGSLIIENGIVQAGIAGALGTASVSFPANVPAGTALQINGFNATITGLNSDPANPGGATVGNGSAAATLTLNSAANNTFAGVLEDTSTGALSLTVTGGGTLVLGGTNTFTGKTIISGASTIQSAVAANLVGLTGQVQFNNGTIHITGDPSNPSAIIYANNTQNKFTTSGNGGATGIFNIDAGVTFQTGGSAATQTTTTAALQTAGSGTAGSSFTKTGLGTMIIYGQNNQQDTSFKFLQGTIDLRSARGLGGQDSNAVRLDMSDGTLLILDNDPGFANSATITPAGVTGTDFLTGLRSATAGGTINLVVDRLTAGPATTHAFGAMQAAGAFTLNVSAGPNMTSGTAGLFMDQNPNQTAGGFNGGITLSGDSTINVINNATTGVGMQMTVNGAVAGAFGLTKDGTGTLTLNTASTYTGTTNVKNGTLRTANAGTISSGPLAINAAAGVTSVASLGNSQTVQSLSTVVAANGTARVDLPAGVTLTVPAAGATNLQGNLTKTGDGTLVINSSLALANNTGVQAGGGTLRLNVSGSSTVGTGVTAAVAAGATLELDGSVSALTDTATPSHRAAVNNDGALNVGNAAVAATTTQQVGGLDGAGNTQVSTGSSLTANHIVQSALAIGGDATTAAVVKIAASDDTGNPLAQGGGLALAGSLGSSSSLPGGSSSFLAAGAPTDGVGTLGPPLGTINLGGGSAAVPEPATMLLLGLGALACLPVLRRSVRRR